MNDLIYFLGVQIFLPDIDKAIIKNSHGDGLCIKMQGASFPF